MPKIELTIDPNYCNEWSLWSAIRELVQNAKDAETEFGATMKISWSNNTLRIENEGCTIPVDCLLLGKTSKADRTDMIGRFGEGLDIALLVLTRLGHTVKVRSGGEVWLPCIEKSERFGCDVLKIDVQTGRKDEKRVRVEIGGVSKERWDGMKQNFLFLADRPRSLEYYHSHILLSPEYKGRIYVKGIWVATKEDLAYGYDLWDARVDRDRKMVDISELDWRILSLWENVLNCSTETDRDLLVGKLWDLLSSPTAFEAKNISCYNASYFSRRTSEWLNKLFKDNFGENCIPCLNNGEVVDVGHLGLRGITLPVGLVHVLRVSTGDIEKIKRDLSSQVVKIYTRDSLSDSEQETLDWAWSKVNAVRTICPVDVVDFRSEHIQGQFNPATQQIALSRKLLTNKYQTLMVLVHEQGHVVGGDGTVQHGHEVEEIWKDIVVTLT